MNTQALVFHTNYMGLFPAVVLAKMI